MAHPLAVPVALALGLGGCAANEVDSDTPLTSTPPAAEPATTESPSQGSVEEPSAVPADAGACLPGVWLADNAYFLALMQEFGDAVDSVEGQVTLTFLSEGTVTTEYDGWQITGVGESGAVLISRDGIDTGVYAVSADRLTLEETEVGSSMTVRMGDMEMAVPPTPAAFTDAPLICDATSASIETTEGTLKLSRS